MIFSFIIISLWLVVGVMTIIFNEVSPSTLYLAILVIVLSHIEIIELKKISKTNYKDK